MICNFPRKKSVADFQTQLQLDFQTKYCLMVLPLHWAFFLRSKLKQSLKMEVITIVIIGECLGFWSSCLCFIIMTLYSVPGREGLDPRHEIAAVEELEGTQCGSHGPAGGQGITVLSPPPWSAELAIWELVKGNLLNRGARWTVFLLTYVHLTKYILKMLADTIFFQNKNWREHFF